MSSRMALQKPKRHLQWHCNQKRKRGDKVMKVIIHNEKYDDRIEFEIDELNEESRLNILEQVHKRGWEDYDCWSEVLND